MSWDNFDVDNIRIGYSHFVAFYPLKWREVSWMHASVIGNLMHSLFKTLFGQDANVIQLGVSLADYEGRLDAVFKVPTPEIALQRLFERYELYLNNRYRRQREFKIPTAEELGDNSEGNLDFELQDDDLLDIEDDDNDLS